MNLVFCVCFGTGYYVNSGMVTDAGVGIGDGGNWVYLVCSLSMIFGDVLTGFPNA